MSFQNTHFKFLNDFKTLNKDLTNVFNPVLGSFTLNNEDIIERYFDVINDNYKGNKTEHFAEKQGDISGLMIDFDCFQTNEKPQIENRHIEKLMTVIAGVINKMFIFDEFSEYHIAVIKRPLVKSANDPTQEILRYSPKHKSFKDGIHILVPEIMITKAQKKYLFKVISDEITKNKVFEDCVFTNKLVDPILDRGSSYVPVFFVGSIKPNTEKRESYPLSFMYKVEPDQDDGHPLEFQKLNVKKMISKYNIPLELSVNKWGIEEMTKKETREFSTTGTNGYEQYCLELEEQEKKQLENDDKYKPSDDNIQQITEKQDEFIIIIGRILKALDEKRADETKSWYGIMNVLKNLINTYDLTPDIIYGLFDEFSKQSKDKYIGSYEAIVDKFENIKGKGYIGLMWHWLYHDNPPEFKAIITDYTKLCPDMEFTYFRDYKKLMKYPVELASVKAWINNCIVFIENGGNPFILTKNIKYDPDTNEKILYYDTIKVGALKLSMAVNVNVKNPDYDPDKKESADNPKYIYNLLSDVIKHSITNRELPNYSNVDFYPYLKEAPKLIDTFNMFNGFILDKYKPKQNLNIDFKASLMYDHILKQICDGDKAVFDYLQKWIALMIQYPANRPDVAIIIVSDQGTGKDMIGEFFSLLIGTEYAMSFDNVDCFFKDFNKEQSNKILIRLNEISDKGTMHSKHDQFKSHITKKQTRIEPKGIDPYSIRHVGHYMCFSNNDNGLRVENSERRFVMIKANNSKANNHEYFKPLWALMNNKDFLKASFDYYANIDLTDFVVRKIPNTKFKDNQKLVNLPTVLKFVVDIMNDDDKFKNIGDCSITKDDSSDDMEITISTKAFFNYYIEWCADTKTKNTTRDAFKNHLVKLDMNETRHRIVMDDVPRRLNGYRFKVSELETKFQEHLRMPEFKFNKSN